MNDTPKVYRWKQRLTEFDMDVAFWEGKLNCVADVLSRLTQPYQKTSPPISKSVYSTALPAQLPLDIIQESITSASVLASPTSVLSCTAPAATVAQENIIADFHNDTCGHLNTLARIRAAGHRWPQMIQHIRNFISHCSQCQHTTPLTKPSHGVRFNLVNNTPFGVIYIDTLGPRDGDARFKYIIVFIDGMTRFVRLYPLPDLSATTVCPVFSTYCHQFRPSSLYFDNHKQFNNASVSNLLQAMSISTVQSTPYSHQENGLVERTIQTVSRHMTNWTLTHPSTDWSTYIPTVEAILNDNPIPGTTITPFQAVFGSLAAKRITSSLPDLLSDVDSSLLEFSSLHEKIVSSKQQDVKDSNASKTLRDFAPGSKILIANQSKSKQFNSVPYIGPFSVISQDSNTLFISDLRTSGTIRRVHIKHVKPLSHDFTESIPQQSDFFDVEAILSHRSTSKGNHIVLVKWKGYDDPSEEYLSRNPSLKKTSAYLEYQKLNPELLK